MKEFINLAWQKKDRKKKAPYIFELVSRFNSFSYSISWEICNCQDEKQRGALISHYIALANVCYEQSNFNALMAILSGLNSNAVDRLKKSWKVRPFFTLFFFPPSPPPLFFLLLPSLSPLLSFFSTPNIPLSLPFSLLLPLPFSLPIVLLFFALIFLAPISLSLFSLSFLPSSLLCFLKATFFLSFLHS